MIVAKDCEYELCMESAAELVLSQLSENALVREKDAIRDICKFLSIMNLFCFLIDQFFLFYIELI